MQGSSFKYPCPNCARFFKLGACSDHVRSCIPGNTYACRVCGEKGIRKTQYRAHAIQCRKVHPAGYGKGCRESVEICAEDAAGASRDDSASRKKKKGPAIAPKKKTNNARNGEKILDQELLVLSARRVLPTDLYKCSRCSIVQGNELMADEHILSGSCPFGKRDAGALDETKRNVSSREKNFVCPSCNQFFTYAQPAVSHIAQCSPETLIHCVWPKRVNKCLPTSSQVSSRDQGRREEKANGAVGKRSSRAQVSVSSDGTEAVVKEVICRLRCPKDLRFLNYCSLAVDPNALFCYRCINPTCRQTLTLSDHNQEHIMEYLWSRRQTKRVLGLLSVSAPLEASSFYSLGSAARSCGIVSNTTLTHLTLAEGLRLPNPNGSIGATDDSEVYAEWLARILRNTKLLQAALCVNPVVRIEALHTIPRSIDEETLLVVADVSLLSYQAKETVDILKSNANCALPQFPFHIAIGACSRSNEAITLPVASQRLEGMELTVDAARMSALAPSLDQKLPQMMASTHAEAKIVAATAARQKSSIEAFGNVRSAMVAAHEINFELSRHLK